MIIHREGNPTIPVEEAIRFAEEMAAAGKECRLALLPKSSEEKDAEKITYEEILLEAEEWIDAQMRTGYTQMPLNDPVVE